jgi:molybdenum-dependent DNA-binding transcriptional regulator ModE
MKLEIGDYIVKKFKTLDECGDLGKEDLKEYLTTLAEELLEEYYLDNKEENEKFNEDEDDE